MVGHMIGKLIHQMVRTIGPLILIHFNEMQNQFSVQNDCIDEAECSKELHNYPGRSIRNTD